MITALVERGRSLLRKKFVQDTLVLQVGKVGLTLLSSLSAILMVRLMGPEPYGIWSLAQGFFAIWQLLDFVAISLSTSTRLSIAIGAKDESEVLNLLGFYVKVTVFWSAFMIVVIGLLGVPLASRLYIRDVLLVSPPGLPIILHVGDSRIGVLASLLAFSILPDMLYSMVLVALQSRRSMRALALMQNVNTLVLTTCIIVAVFINPQPESLVAARLVYSYSTSVLALMVYSRIRHQGTISYPPLRAVFERAVTVSPRKYWRFGAALALDKNISNLFIRIPVQMVGILAGSAAAGYLQLALTGLSLPGVLTSAVLDNMQAVVPQMVGRGDYRGLLRNFTRVLLTLFFGGAFFYAVFAVLAPLVIPPVLGLEWIPAAPLAAVLAIYGAVTTVGGIFGPLYRAFGMVKEALIIKLLTIVIVIVPGALLVESLGEHGGAWMVNLLFAISVLGTALICLRALNERARIQP